MKRRTFITLLGGAAVAPLAARAQQKLPVIGYLSGRSQDSDAFLLEAFRAALAEAGFIEGKSVTFAFRWANGAFERLPTLADELVKLRVSAIASIGGGTNGAWAAKRATPTIPVVFSIGGDPVKAGLVASLNRPGGNVTGVSLIGGLLDAKRLELMRELVPNATAIAVLRNPGNPNMQAESDAIDTAARKLGIRAPVFNASTASEIDDAFARLVPERVDALVVATDPFLNGRFRQIVALAEKHAMPATYGPSDFSIAGGLISYGASRREGARIAGQYVGQILKGANPSELPVQFPTKYELVINLATARTLGLEIPASILVRADEVIE